MKPYYEADGVTIYCGDCREILPTLSGVGVDFVFADPPYNSGLAYGESTDDKRDAAEYWAWLDERVALMRAVGRVVAVKHSALKITDFLARHPGSRVLVWYKPFSSGYPLNGIATHWEPIYVLQGKAENWTKDVIEVSSGNTNPEGRTGHPAQFPEELARRLIVTFTKDEPTYRPLVVDAFAGSGTMLRAAKDMGRRAIGIEIEERYCEIAAKRLSQTVLDFGGAA